MAKKTVRRKMGRPPLPASERRLPSTSFRPTPAIRRRLENAAKANQRSLSQEIQARLEGSFLEEDARYAAFGGAKPYRLCQMLPVMAAMSANMATEPPDGRPEWFDDPVEFTTLATAWEAFVRDFLGGPLATQNLAKFAATTSTQTPPDTPGRKAGLDFGESLVRLSKATGLSLEKLAAAMADDPE